MQISPGLNPSTRAVSIAALATRLHRPLLVVTARQDSADALGAALSELLPAESPPLTWISPDPLPYEQLPHDPDLSSTRIAVLDELVRAEPGQTLIVISSMRALMSYIRDRDSFTSDALEIVAGGRIDDRRFMRQLVASGYRREPVADVAGTVSQRGGIIDVVPPGRSDGIRIELFGDEVESVRRFDPASQRSTGVLDSVRILPPIEFDIPSEPEDRRMDHTLNFDHLRPEVHDEWIEILERLQSGDVPDAIDLLAPSFARNRSTLLDYAPADSIVVQVEPEMISIESEQLELRAAEVYGALLAAGEIPAGLERPFATPAELQEQVDRFRLWIVGSAEPETHGRIVRTRECFVEPPMYAGDIDTMASDIRQRLDHHWRVVIATDQTERVRDLLEERDLLARVARSSSRRLIEPPAPGTFDIVHARLDSGFVVPDAQTMVLTDRELFGIRKAARQAPRHRRQRHRPVRDFKEGQYVVHVQHGVGVFKGLVTLDLSGVEREYLQVDYAQADRLYVPVDQTDRLAPYESPAGTPRITRLSSAEWTRTKARVRKAVQEMAAELLQIYAAREMAGGQSFPPDTTWDVELAESFPFRETPDQHQAIDDVRDDLESTKPMDRLVCGDVGYGKTEVALRAAFKVVNAGQQVAVLVPTTVLALQHYETFRERLAAFPVRVEMLSRLRTRSEQRQILDDLENGLVDIVIGTHRLVQRDVQFKELGLLVVDGEQRFGVRHKEFIKRQRAAIDVLTMTATPIPRTLYMALTGIRDLSLISTPPQERVPIRTFVTARSDSLVREAILREMFRGGQVFFLHNRVQSIYRIREWLEELVPEASIGIGHGQMKESELEHVVLAFMQHEYDVLLCTTIIESGVDIPNANTIIMDNAHALGLTQLYQLRGRVGRGNVRAYAYLLYPLRTPLSGEARQRLAAIQEATELGAGFQIAMRDMEIRGAGNILGAEQSGHIAAVGLDLYTRMLSHAVEELRAGRTILEPEDVNIDIAVDGRIPDDYIQDETMRLSFYYRISSAATSTELGELRAELVDRFGPVPPAAERIFDLVRLRHTATQLGITGIVERDGTIVIRPVIGSRLSERELKRELGAGVRITPNQVRLTLPELEVDRWSAIQGVLRAVESIRSEVLAAS
ncbi:transcription-repair coupling factor [soil metagenome]